MAQAIIYKLTSPSGKSYVGQTRQELGKRLHTHHGQHSTCRAIKRAIEKYGIESFGVCVIASVDPDMADSVEISAIKNHETLAPKGYNLTEGGKYPAMSEETRAKMSASSLGKPKSEEARKNMSLARIGKKLSPETCARISAAKKGTRPSEETLRKLSAIRMGHPVSAETREKLRIAHTGKVLSAEHRKKLSISHMGHIPSRETVAKRLATMAILREQRIAKGAA